MIPNDFFSEFPVVKSFKSHNRWYGLDELGVIHQLDAKPFTYDEKYVSTYDTEGYKRESEKLQALRWGFVCAAHGEVPLRLLDWGYGNGAFLTFARQQHFYACGIVTRVVGHGYDLTGLTVPGCFITTGPELAINFNADVVTFWDSLEHVPDLRFLRELKAQTVVISLPHCHYHTLSEDWFNAQYKHRKPDEHLHHFSVDSLRGFMNAMGWKSHATSNHEDIVRKSPGDWPNILTMAFHRR